MVHLHEIRGTGLAWKGYAIPLTKRPGAKPRGGFERISGFQHRKKRVESTIRQ